MIGRKHMAKAKKNRLEYVSLKQVADWCMAVLLVKNFGMQTKKRQDE